MGLVRGPHGVGKSIVPGALIVDGVALRITGRQRLDQRPLGRGDATDQCEGSVGRIIGTSERRRLTGGVLQFPGEVIVRPDRIGDTPMSHGAVRVSLQRLLKAGDCFLMMVAKAPVEAMVEPALGILGGGGHLPGIGAEIIRIVHVAASSLAGEVAPRAHALPSSEHSRGWPDARALFTGA